MRQIWIRTGRILYWCTRPVVLAYLHGTTRTRVVVRHGYKVLVVQGWLSDGTWELPGGGVHRGEEVLAAAIRELHEETGITLKPRMLKKLSTTTFSSGFARFDVICFALRLPHVPDIRLQRIEIADARWVTRKQLKSMKLADGVIDAVERCFKT